MGLWFESGGVAIHQLLAERLRPRHWSGGAGDRAVMAAEGPPCGAGFREGMEVVRR